MDDFATKVVSGDDECFIVECLGILGNLVLADLDYSMILHKHNMIPWIRNVLVPGNKTFFVFLHYLISSLRNLFSGNTKDDIVLDCVVFLGTCASDESCAMLLCKADVILSLIELLKAKQEDDEMVLQIIFVFQQVLINESTRSYMIKDTESPAYLIDLMHDKNCEIRKVCDYCLDIIAISDSDWASRIKVGHFICDVSNFFIPSNKIFPKFQLEKFRNHNSQWLSMVETQEADDIQDFGAVEDEELPVYLTSDYLNQIYQSGESHDDSDVRTSSNNSSRPVSRYSKDFEDFDILKLAQPSEVGKDL